MKTQAYYYNNELFISDYKQLTLELLVTTQMIASVIELSQHRKWKIVKLGMQLLSNRMRDCATMKYTASAYVIHNILDSLQLSHVDHSNIEYYRSRLEVSRERSVYSRMNKPACLVYDSVSKSWNLTANKPVPDATSRQIGNIIVTSRKKLLKSI